MTREGRGPRTQEEALANRVEALPLLAPLREALVAAGVSRAWLVGGALRDVFAGAARQRPDLDVALPGSGEGAARAVARDLGGTAFPLDEVEGSWRVALAGGGTVDLVPLRAVTLAQDLAGRDFTVNALAFDLLGLEGLLDPLGGGADLAAGRLRACSPRALLDDPLRVLRAYRFAAALHLEFEEALPGLLAEAAPRLGSVSPERLRTELFAVLDLPGPGASLRAMARDGVLGALFPFLEGWKGFDQGSYHAYDLWEHSLRTAEAAGALARAPAPIGLPRPETLGRHLDEEWEAGITRRALLVFVALFHDVAKPETATTEPTEGGERRRFLGHEVRGGQRVKRLLAELRVGRRTAGAAQRLVAAHLRLFQLAAQEPPTPRARLRYLVDLGREVPEALLLSLADELATGPAPPCLAAVRRTAQEVLELFWERRDARPATPLLRGRDVVDKLGIAPGPQVGDLLRRVQEAERSGRVRTRRQALALARRLAGEG
ncbi:MAG: HD domain-containing protein [Thermodesulfobacteriota bacterium]